MSKLNYNIEWMCSYGLRYGLILRHTTNQETKNVIRKIIS